MVEDHNKKQETATLEQPMETPEDQLADLHELAGVLEEAEGLLFLASEFAGDTQNPVLRHAALTAALSVRDVQGLLAEAWRLRKEAA